MVFINWPLTSSYFAKQVEYPCHTVSSYQLITNTVQYRMYGTLVKLHDNMFLNVHVGDCARHLTVFVYLTMC